ncbi:DUF3611 family protein [Leptothoe sp. PORK10 BA2]|uniref:DUF3611 family protein n=1 Tax=Leptothoe sp. PORK10 BA2 TaxID=3110254 RepID=UPI002B1ED191|nr:DUF3611 family protein [Leptothoe sp. PORK10 BA2]MEA5463170.1 DUF3611 family protein [Leptothoe sp. PORK10 BA2]
MTGELGYSLPPAVRRIANNFRLVGWLSFWVQIVSGVIATLLFVTSLLGLQSVTNRGGGAENAAAGGGFLLAALGLVAVYVGAFWAFQYTLFARKLKSTNPDLRPKPKAAAKIIATGLVISILGMFFGLLGAGGVVGALMLKVISQPQGNVALANPSLAVEPLDVFLVQSTVNTLISHFAGLVGCLWLSRTINKQS